MSLITDMIPMVLPFARGAGEPAAELELRNAAIEFCQKTHAWLYMIEDLDVTQDKREVELPLPDGAELHEVRQVWYRGDPLDPMSTDTLDQYGIRPTSTGTPKVYEFSEWVLKLWPLPLASEEAVIQVRVSLYPTDDADQIPDEMFKRYRRTIAHGALARLLRYDEPWAKAAAQAANAQGFNYAGLFQADIDSAAHMVARSNVRSRRRTKGHWL